MTDTQELNSGAIAHDFRAQFAETLPQAVLDDAMAQIGGSAAAGFPATLSFTGLLLNQLRCAIAGGETFIGTAWGLPGTGEAKGDVYTGDIARLYAETTSFALTTTPVYISLVFFGEDGAVLGSFQGGAVSTVVGAGGGVGRWQ